MSRALISLTLAASLGACVDNGDEGIFITKNVIPEDGCTFAASETSPFLTHGEISMFSPSAYRLFPQMKSRITAREGQEDQRTIIAQGARITLTFTNPTLEATLKTNLGDAGFRALTQYTTLFSAPIAPNGGITDAAFDLIPRRVLDEIAAAAPDARTPGSGFSTELLTSVVVYGDLAGGEVTSQPFSYPVTACTDCIINDLGACPLPAGTEVVNTGNVCNPFQDGVVDCCGSGASFLCPAQVATEVQ